MQGPSGSGKTTLLNVIAGRTASGWLSGHRIFDGQKLEQKEYEMAMSRQGYACTRAVLTVRHCARRYVLQTDTFFTDLTVREMLCYCAMLRMGDQVAVQHKMAHVWTVMTDVNLIKQADAIIGGQGSGVAGISGGQRRRLSVAIELLTNPAILILDEPTSGLDATCVLLHCELHCEPVSEWSCARSSSHQLVTLLNKIASEHDRTVLLTIHQPRAESFELFDQLLLLGEVRAGHW